MLVLCTLKGREQMKAGEKVSLAQVILFRFYLKHAGLSSQHQPLGPRVTTGTSVGP